MKRDETDWNPRGARNRVSITGTATLEDGTQATVLVSDISYQGCHIWSDQNFLVGETLHLTLPAKGRLAAQVRWSESGRVGLRFLTGQSVRDERRARLGI